MILKVGHRRYESNTTMRTLLKYRIEFGESFLEKMFSEDFDVASMVRLMWCSIDHKNYNKFLKAAVRDKTFPTTAFEFQKQILMIADAKCKDHDSGSETINELDILAMMAICGISVDLVDRLPVFLIIDVISRRNDIMMPRDKKDQEYRKFTKSEMRQIYGG